MLGNEGDASECCVPLSKELLTVRWADPDQQPGTHTAACSLPSPVGQ